MKTRKNGRCKKRPQNRILFIFWICVFVIVSVLFFSQIIKKSEQIKPKIYKNEIKIKKNIKKDENLTKITDDIKQNLDENFTEQIKQENLPKILEISDLNFTKIEANETKPKIIVKKPQNLPKLAIIIDDVATFSQARMIKSVNLKLTPSIFPVSKNYPNTAKFAKIFKTYMIHLPLEALHYKNAEKNTILTNYDTNQIREILTQIRKDFPKAKFINNHTGSKFTSDLEAMQRLVLVLDELGFYFLDSKTIASTKANIAMKNANHRYIWRDVFLDNINKKENIQKELQKAVNIAKDRGFAVAIGHAREITLKTLSDSFEILKDVEVIYLEDIYEYYK